MFVVELVPFFSLSLSSSSFPPCQPWCWRSCSTYYSPEPLQDLDKSKQALKELLEEVHVRKVLSRRRSATAVAAGVFDTFRELFGHFSVSLRRLSCSSPVILFEL